MKTNLDKHFKVSEKYAKDGVDFAIDDKTSFRIRYFNISNPRVKAAMAAHYKPFARQVELGTLDQATQIEIQIKLFIDISLVSWTGIEDDGKELECNPQNALALFKHLPEMFDTLWSHANDHKNYKEDLGNS